VYFGSKQKTRLLRCDIEFCKIGNFGVRLSEGFRDCARQFVQTLKPAIKKFKDKTIMRRHAM